MIGSVLCSGQFYSYPKSHSVIVGPLANWPPGQPTPIYSTTAKCKIQNVKNAKSKMWKCKIRNICIFQHVRCTWDVLSFYQLENPVDLLQRPRVKFFGSPKMSKLQWKCLPSQWLWWVHGCHKKIPKTRHVILIVLVLPKGNIMTKERQRRRNPGFCAQTTSYMAVNRARDIKGPCQHVFSSSTPLSLSLAVMLQHHQ